MFQVTANESAVTIVITDPVVLERLMVVLARTNSTKVIALRESIKAQLAELVITEQASPAKVESMITDLEAMLASHECKPDTECGE